MYCVHCRGDPLDCTCEELLICTCGSYRGLPGDPRACLVHTLVEEELKVICLECHVAMPDNQLLCRSCAEKKSYRVNLERQKMFLPEVVANRVELTLVQANKWSQKHIQLFQAPTLLYCGSTSEGGKKLYAKLDVVLDKLQPEVCVLCRNRLKELIEEVSRVETH
jgi:hypothetical protein